MELRLGDACEATRGGLVEGFGWRREELFAHRKERRLMGLHLSPFQEGAKARSEG